MASFSSVNYPIQIEKWENIIDLSIKHRIVNKIEKQTKALKVSLPADLNEKISNQSKNSTLKMLLFTAEISLICEAFNKLSISVIPLKGPIASKQIYGDFAAKNSRDIDLLIKEEHLEKCIAEIENLGYINSYPFNSLSKKQKKAFQRSNNQLAFFHPKKKIQVEIHWRLFANRHLLPLTFDELLIDSTQIIVGKTTINCLSETHLLLYLCAHGSKHQWSLLYWLLEVATLTQKVKYDWEKILKESQELGVYRALVQGLILIELLFNLPAHKVIKEHYQENEIIQKLVELSREIIMEEVSFSQKTSVSNYLKILKYKLKISSNIQYKLAYFKLNSINDFKLVKLPDSLFFGYFWLRPVFWFWRYIIHPKKQ
ncbi:MAG: hypothetical protein ACJARP_000509 [Vicingaceae bacterium]